MYFKKRKLMTIVLTLKNNGELSKTDANVDNINRVLAYVKGQQSLFNTPTPADKSTAYLLSHGYFLNTKH